MPHLYRARDDRIFWNLDRPVGARERHARREDLLLAQFLLNCGRRQMVALGSWNGAVGHLAETGVNDEPTIMAIRNWQSMSTDLVHDGRISPLRGGNIGFGGNLGGMTQPRFFWTLESLHFAYWEFRKPGRGILGTQWNLVIRDLPFDPLLPRGLNAALSPGPQR
jgi:hypothetical protein